jgi:hypothetical protein
MPNYKFYYFLLIFIMVLGLFGLTYFLRGLLSRMTSINATLAPMPMPPRVRRIVAPNSWEEEEEDKDEDEEETQKRFQLF